MRIDEEVRWQMTSAMWNDPSVPPSLATKAVAVKFLIGYVMCTMSYENESYAL